GHRAGEDQWLEGRARGVQRRRVACRARPDDDDAFDAGGHEGLRSLRLRDVRAAAKAMGSGAYFGAGTAGGAGAAGGVFAPVAGPVALGVGAPAAGFL